jgi:hypothetical protein
MKIIYKYRVFSVVAVMFLFIFFFGFCEKGKSDKDLILELVESMEKLIEDQYTASILDLLTENFRDMENRAKPEMEEVLNRYFESYSGIVVNILGTHFKVLKPDQAEIQTDVSLSHGAAKMFRKIVPYSGQTYRFTIRLKKTDQKWKVFYAEWRYAYLEELFPESIKILKKLFPKLR